jgi:D-3-phosphoglycerate dehydrogenase / 2-oxoglutarate reductase
MNIVILDDYQDVVRHLACFSLLNRHTVRVLTTTYTNSDELAEKIQDTEALVLIRERTLITEALLSKLPSLKIIAQTGKAGNHIDLVACEKHRVLVCDGKGSPIAPSELCWALILAASRHIVPYATNMRNDTWQSSGTLGLGRALNGLTLGIWGYGNIGQRVAGFGNVFGMKILVWGSETSRANAKAHGFETASSQAEFFATSDVVSLHLKLTDATKRCVTQSDLDAMKADSLFVNISRAELVEKGALYASLKKTPTKHAAIDVFETEPATAKTEPLLTLPNVLSTPHIGYVEQNNYENYFKAAFENIVAFAQGKPQNEVK